MRTNKESIVLPVLKPEQDFEGARAVWFCRFPWTRCSKEDFRLRRSTGTPTSGRVGPKWFTVLGLQRVRPDLSETTGREPWARQGSCLTSGPTWPQPLGNSSFGYYCWIFWSLACIIVTCRNQHFNWPCCARQRNLQDWRITCVKSHSMVCSFRVVSQCW